LHFISFFVLSLFFPFLLRFFFFLHYYPVLLLLFFFQTDHAENTFVQLIYESIHDCRKQVEIDKQVCVLDIRKCFSLPFSLSFFLPLNFSDLCSNQCLLFSLRSWRYLHFGLFINDLKLTQVISLKEFSVSFLLGFVC